MSAYEIRNMNPKRYFGMGNAAVITDHFQQAWDHLKIEVPDGKGKESARAMIYSHAKNAAMALGETEVSAEEFARGIVELPAGEKIMSKAFSMLPEAATP